LIILSANEGISSSPFYLFIVGPPIFRWYWSNRTILYEFGREVGNYRLVRRLSSSSYTVDDHFIFFLYLRSYYGYAPARIMPRAIFLIYLAVCCYAIYWITGWFFESPRWLENKLFFIIAAYALFFALFQIVVVGIPHFKDALSMMNWDIAEYELAKACRNLAPLVAVGDRYQTSGALKLFSTDEQWPALIDKLAAASTIIFLAPGASPSVI